MGKERSGKEAFEVDKIIMITDFFLQLSTLGYIGIFLISLIGSSTIIFPLPAAVFVFGAGAIMNPLILGTLAGTGAAIGELIGYVLGFSGRKLGEKHFKEQLKKTKQRFEKYRNFNGIIEKGGFLTLVIFAATPLPDDVVGIVSGVLKYEIKKFFVAVLIGKIIFHLGVAFAGYYGIKGILNYIS